MRQFLLSALLICTYNVVSLSAQDIKFKDPVRLFIHPDERAWMQFPFIPYDSDGDDLIDFIGSNFEDDFLFKATSLNSFEEIVRGNVGFPLIPLKVIDINADGHEDIVCLHSILISDGAGDFTRISPAYNFSEFIVAIDDLNNDGLQDYLTELRDFPNLDRLILYRNEGNLEFTPDTILTNVDLGDVDTGDMDGDGDVDIVYRELFVEDFGAILYNEDSLFREERIVQKFDAKNRMDLVDRNSDGLLDILAFGPSEDLLTITNSDNFGTGTSYGRYTRPNIEYGKTADFNNDGEMDDVLLINENDSFNIRVYQGENSLPRALAYASPSVFYDENHDRPLPNYGNNNIIPYDYNKDGAMDIIYTDGFNDPPQVVWFENVTFTASTSDSKNEIKSFIQPNPVNDFLSIRYALPVITFDYSIFNTDGITLVTGRNDRNINVTNLPAGLYFFKSQELNLVERFIKI